MAFFDKYEREERKRRYREAQQFLKEAESAIKEGKRDYEYAKKRYESALAKAEDCLWTQRSIKSDAASTLKNKIAPILKEFKKFNIETKIETVSKVNVDIPDKIPSSGVSVNLHSSMKCAIDSINGSLFSAPDISNFLAELFFSDNDYYKALDKKNEANQYKWKMKSAANSYERYRANLDALCDHLHNEKYMIRSLVDKVESLAIQLKAAMTKTSFSEEEATQLKGVNLICRNLVRLLNEDFLTDGAKIQKKYKKYYDFLKQIDDTIPAVPAINSIDWVKILQIAVVR